jgi:predicted metalloprotease
MGGGTILGGGIGAAVIGLIIYLLGGDPSQIIGQGGAGGPISEDQKAAQADYQEFVEVTLKDTEDVWGDVFSRMGKTYQPTTLVLFSGSVNSKCGDATAQSGPFYCPLDKDVYIDLTFYDELKQRFKASGDFAMAYVIAHEVGHHVQDLLGISEKVQRLQQQGSREEANALSVRLELQADFLAGVWANHTQKMKNTLDPDDIEEALNAANAIGDDRLQKEAQGHVSPETFTHGTSQQRMYWFKKGFDTGDINQGDTFASDAI